MVEKKWIFFVGDGGGKCTYVRFQSFTSVHFCRRRREVRKGDIILKGISAFPLFVL